MPIPTQNNLAAHIESRANEPQDFVCFLDAETGQTVSYYEVRMRAVWLARELDAQQVQRGGMCAVDMQNCPALIYTLAAAAYGGFSVVLINTSLTEAEKIERIEEVKRSLGIAHIPILDEATALALISEFENSAPAERNQIAAWARRGVGAFDDEAPAIVLFASGASGRAKAALFTWEKIMAATRASNEMLNTEGEGVWQMVLPGYHAGGIGTALRSVVNKNAFILYRNFDAEQVLKDAHIFSATHIALTDKMLQELLSFETNPQEHNEDLAYLATYQCILLDDLVPNKATYIRALGQHAPVYASYGTIETFLQVACALVVDSEQVLLDIVPGWEVTIAAPDESGFGQLAVRGPGVADGYLNARAAFTADGFFLTGDSARLQNGRLEIAPRMHTSFLSGGENIYPAEIRDKILAIEGVTDAYVFGAAHASWGRRPVAFVEATAAASRPGYNSFYFADDIRNRLSPLLSETYLPDHFVVMQEFPRTGLGKVGEGTLERAWDTRLHITKVEIWHIRLPLATPLRTPHSKFRYRDSIVVRFTDHAGRFGIGEYTAPLGVIKGKSFDADLELIRDALAPLLIGRVLLHPGQATELFENIPESREAYFARACLETALWDLYGKIRGRSIRYLIGAREVFSEPGSTNEVPFGCVPAGAVIGLGSPSEVLAQVSAVVEEGYRRVKLKIKPGFDIAVVKAVREAYPTLRIMLDAEQSYHDNQIDVLQQLDTYAIECIEEPLDPSFMPAVGPTNIFDRLVRLQMRLRMKVCLDESYSTAEQLYEILETHPELRCVSLKIGKFGGALEALTFYKWAHEKGIEVWPGGAYETGISRRLHAAFAMLPGVNMVGDIGESTRYFTVDICRPSTNLEEGAFRINSDEYSAGLGCELNEEVLRNVTEAHWVI